MVQEERLVWFHPCACVYASNPRDEPEFSEDPELEPPSLLLLRLWFEKNVDSVYAGGVDTSQSFSEGPIPIMT